MIFSDVTPSQLPIVWQWITENPDLHMGDDGPKTLQEFVSNILADNIKLIGIHNGRKFIGAVGFHEDEDHNEVRGIHFIEEARHQGYAAKALSAIIVASEPKPVRLLFPADNPFMLGFIRKFHGKFLPTDTKVKRAGEEVPCFAVELKTNPLVTLS